MFIRSHSLVMTRIRTDSTYVQDLIRDLCRLPLLLLEVRGIPVQLRGVSVLVEASLHAEELLVHCELIPRATIRPRTEGELVLGRTRSSRRRARIGPI